MRGGRGGGAREEGRAREREKEREGEREKERGRERREGAKSQYLRLFGYSYVECVECLYRVHVVI